MLEHTRPLDPIDGLDVGDIYRLPIRVRMSAPMPALDATMMA
jgi:hypothetical protein